MATFTVTNLLDSGMGSLRESIIDANTQAGADEIIFESELSGGTIDLTSGALTISDSLTIDGLGADLLTVDGDGNSRVFNVSDGESSENFDGESETDVFINGLTITGGSGGISNEEELTITDSIISGNSADDGGGILHEYGFLTVNNSIISGNEASRYGGGIDIFSEYYGSVTVSNSTISGNTAANSGGGIRNDGSLDVSSSTISGNTTGGDGGGIDNPYLSGVDLSNSTISGNTAGGDGGGINNGYYSDLSVSNSTISGNEAGGNGGSIDNEYIGADLTVSNSTISGNSANSGGGIFTSEEPDYYAATVNNTIIAGNNGTPPDVFGDFDSNGFNLIGDTTGSTGFEDDLVEADINQILETNLELNGAPPGTPLTLALVPGSPAIDAGNNADVPSGIEFDERGPGFERIVNGTVDIGAFEVQQAEPPTSVPEPSSLLGVLGLAVFASKLYWQRRRQT